MNVFTEFLMCEVVFFFWVGVVGLFVCWLFFFFFMQRNLLLACLILFWKVFLQRVKREFALLNFEIYLPF